MSFSFPARAATKAALKLVIAAELDKVVAAQPAHAVDQDQIQAAAGAYVDVVAEDEGKDLLAHVNGSIWQSEAGVQSIGFGISVGLVAKVAT